MNMMEEFLPDFTGKMDELREDFKKTMPIDEKTYQFICLALAVKARSPPCVKKHFREALEAGATVKEVCSILSLVMMEAASADSCWIHSVIGDWTQLLMEDFKTCSCMR